MDDYKTTLFEDAQKLAKENPKTFYAPSPEQLNKLKVADLVKVCTAYERFWTVIKQINGDDIVAKIDNDLQHTEEHGLSCGDTVKFKLDNIYQIYKE